MMSRRGLAGALVCAAPPLLAFALRGSHPLVALAAWTLTLGVSFYGAGSLLARVLSLPAASRVLRIAWGMALVEWAIGSLAATHLGGRPALFAVVAVGFGWALVELAREPIALVPIVTKARRTIAARPAVAAAIGLALAFATLRSVLSLRTRAEGYLYDDGEAYLVFVRQLVETGDFDQPFSLRRLQSFGGMTGLLGTLFCNGGDEWSHAYVFDWGLSYALVLAFVLQAKVKGRAGALVRAGAVVLVALLPQPRTNVTAEYTALFFGLTLAATLELLGRDTKLVQRVVVGLLAAALAALRQNLVAWAALLVVCHHALAALRDRSSLGTRLRGLAVDGALTVAFLVPWMVQSYRNFATPLYPVIHGDVWSEAASFMSHSAPLARHLANVLMTVGQSLPFGFVGFFALVVAWAARTSARSPSSSASAALVAALGTWAFQLWGLPLTDAYSHARYAFAWAMAGGLTVLLAAAAPSTARRSRFVSGAALAAVVLSLVSASDAILRPVRDDLRFVAGDARVVHPARDDGPRNARYAAAQAAVPAGARFLTMSEESYRFDLRRNAVTLFDFPGALGKDAPFPALGGPAAMRAYLRAHGFRYLVFEHGGVAEAMFSRSDWSKHLGSSDDDAARQAAPYWLATFDGFDALAHGRAVLFDDGILSVVDLDVEP